MTSRMSTWAPLALAEVEARVAFALDAAPRAERDLDRVPHPDLALANLSSYHGIAAVWLIQLRRFDEGLEHYRAAITYSVQRREMLAAAGQLRLRDWLGALESVLRTRSLDLADRLLAIVPPLGDGTLTDLGEHWAMALGALVRGDQAAARAAAEAMAAIGDERALKGKSLPRRGQAIIALLDGDVAAFRRELDAMCTQHVVFATRGYLKGSEAGLVCKDVVALLTLAARRGIEVDVAEEYHRVKMTFPVTHLREWQGENVYMSRIKLVVDSVPAVLVG